MMDHRHSLSISSVSAASSHSLSISAAASAAAKAVSASSAVPVAVAAAGAAATSTLNNSMGNSAHLNDDSSNQRSSTSTVGNSCSNHSNNGRIIQSNNSNRSSTMSQSHELCFSSTATVDIAEDFPSSQTTAINSVTYFHLPHFHSPSSLPSAMPPVSRSPHPTLQQQQKEPPDRNFLSSSDEQSSRNTNHLKTEAFNSTATAAPSYCPSLCESFLSTKALSSSMEGQMSANREYSNTNSIVTDSSSLSSSSSSSSEFEEVVTQQITTTGNEQLSHDEDDNGEDDEDENNDHEGVDMIGQDYDCTAANACSNNIDGSLSNQVNEMHHHHRNSHSNYCHPLSQQHPQHQHSNFILQGSLREATCSSMNNNNEQQQQKADQKEQQQFRQGPNSNTSLMFFYPPHADADDSSSLSYNSNNQQLLLPHQTPMLAETPSQLSAAVFNLVGGTEEAEDVTQTYNNINQLFPFSVAPLQSHCLQSQRPHSSSCSSSSGSGMASSILQPSSHLVFDPHHHHPYPHHNSNISHNSPFGKVNHHHRHDHNHPTLSSSGELSSSSVGAYCNPYHAQCGPRGIIWRII